MKENSKSNRNDRPLSISRVPGHRESVFGAPPPEIEGYKIIDKLGESGQAQIWRAVQLSTQRQVALKIPRLCLLSYEKVLARFEREVELAARLKHPNIARIHDSGIRQGLYYCAMDLIEGTHLDVYVKDHNLNQRETLELMRTVCQAVQYAHQNGVIHRDLKPSNIMVTEDGQPYIVDFGLAKSLLEDDLALTISECGDVAGTPAYMSPEQAAGHSDTVDTRTDVYSLGAILFTLLTGSNPHDLSGTRLEVMHKIAEQEIIHPRTINRNIDKDIEALLLKALERDPDRRYSSAAGFVEDIDNYLNGKPLVAGPPTSSYRLKKFVRRHKSLVASLITVLAVLMAGVIVSSVFALKAHRQAQRLVSIVDFLTLDVLGSARQVTGRDATVIDLIDVATLKLDAGAFKDQPFAAESLIRFRLGNLIKELGYPNKAIPHLERVREIYLEHGVTPPHIRPSHDGSSHHLIMNYLALAYLSSGEREKAETLFQQIIEEKEETNNIYTNLYPFVKRRAAQIYRMKAQYTESERILLEIMDPQFRNGEGPPPDPNYMANCMRELAESYQGQGRYEEAEQIYIKVQEMSKQVPSRQLAWLYIDIGRYPEAEELLRAEIERIPRELPGKDHTNLITAKNALAVLLTKKGDFDEAERLFEEVWKVEKEKWPDDHPSTLATINAFGVLRREQKNYKEAESLLRHALDGRLRKLGKEYPDCFGSMHELAVLYKEQARYEEAEKLLLEAVEGRRLKLGDKHPDTIKSLNELIALYEAWNKPEKAKEWRAKLPQTEVVNK